MSIQEQLLAEIADAIRQKSGTTDAIIAKDFAQAILDLPEGGGSSGGGGGAGPVKAPKLTVSSTLLQHAKYISVHSDTELAKDISTEKLNIQDSGQYIVDLIRTDDLNFILNCNELSIGTNIQIQALAALFINNNGDSNVLTINIDKHVIDNLYNLYNTPVGLIDIMKTDTYVDGSTYTIPVTASFWSSIASLLSVNADGVVTFDRITLKINARDSSLRQLSYEVYSMKNDTETLKIRWRGLAHYSNYTTEYTWELFFTHGAIVICLINQPSSYFNGEFTISTPLGTFNYTLSAETPFVTFYCTNSTGMMYNIINEKYDSSKVLPPAPESCTLDELIAYGTTYMASALLETDNDEGSYTVNILSWPYKGSVYNSCTVNGNSWITLPGHNELIKMNRRDASVWSIYYQTTVLNFNDVMLEATKVRWDGKAHYSQARDQIWDLYLFANGDAMIHLVKKSSSYWNGVFNFFGVSYTISEENTFVSFYRQNTDGTEWTVHNNKYDVNLSKNLIN